MTLEIVNEWGEISSVVVKDRRPIERLQPRLTNDKAPLFAIVNALGYWTSPVTPAKIAQPTQTIPELLRVGPIVKGLYCPCWCRYAEPFLEALTQLAQRVQSVDQAGRIRYHFLDKNFEGLSPDDESTQTAVLDALYP
jgi:hypothetical protein